MPNYNKNSVFAVSSAGTIPNRVDDLILFQDIAHDEKQAWNEFENLMSVGDYAGANAYAKACADVHGYFSDLYNLMVNRIKAVQEFLVLNETNINNATGSFSSFKKPDIFVYQSEPNTPKNILQDQVWIGPKGYYDEVVVKEGINKLKINESWISSHNSGDYGITFDLEDGYIIINGSLKPGNGLLAMRIGTTPLPDNITPANIWSYWNYYVSGNVSNYNRGTFTFMLYPKSGDSYDIGDIRIYGELSSDVPVVPTSRTANMHANFVKGISNGTLIDLFFVATYGEVYNDLKVGFMVCKTAETTPNQKFVKYEG